MKHTTRAHTSFCSIVLMLSSMLPSCGSNQGENTGCIPKPPDTAQSPSIAFGKDAWESHFGAIGEEPALPSNIDKILERTCPFCPDKTIKETHFLVLIPAIVDDNPFTLDLLGELVKNPKKGHSTGFQLDYGKGTIQKYLGATAPRKHAYWVLMTREVVSESLVKNASPEYDLPTILEAATVILSHHVHKGKWLYERTHTYCKETILDHTGSSPKKVYVGKHQREDRFMIDHKNPTIIRFEDSTDIPHAARGKALLRKL